MKAFKWIYRIAMIVGAGSNLVFMAIEIHTETEWRWSFVFAMLLFIALSTTEILWKLQDPHPKGEQ